MMVQMYHGIICTGSTVYLSCLRVKRHDLPWWVNNGQAEDTKVQDATCQRTVIFNTHQRKYLASLVTVYCVLHHNSLALNIHLVSHSKF